jgi:hypothetical protein
LGYNVSSKGEIMRKEDAIRAIMEVRNQPGDPNHLGVQIRSATLDSVAARLGLFALQQDKSFDYNGFIRACGVSLNA